MLIWTSILSCQISLNPPVNWAQQRSAKPFFKQSKLNTTFLHGPTCWNQNMFLKFGAQSHLFPRSAKTLTWAIAAVYNLPETLGKYTLRFFFIATVAGGADLFFIECHNPGNHWWVFQQTKTCNLQRFVSVFSSVFLVEEVTFWTLRRLGIFPDPSHISRVGPVPVEQLADIVGRATTRTREIGIQVGPPAGTGIGFPMGHMGRALSSVPVVGDPIQASGSNIYNTMSDLFGR